MGNKKFILNADDFGMSKAFNRAVLDGYHNGFLTSASLCANGKAFNAAVNEIIPECPNLGTGVHLNIMEGRSLTKAPMLTNKRGKFNNSYLKLILKSTDYKFLEQVEYEFRTQIETVMNYTKVDHIDSHVHTHAIPNIFKITAKLAKEYKIPFIRTQYEEMYFVPSIKKHLNFKYPPNILKILLLNSFTKINIVSNVIWISISNIRVVVSSKTSTNQIFKFVITCTLFNVNNSDFWFNFFKFFDPSI